ncbi:unnamed protein product [Strongylus vulgaris]|uniref:Uncharacterized protein n=1 Tax=Strongylus vulgaris TaxID=40348 RepID=A0A3P7JFH8_STRVU|nr:unnamed protein product [Strongylus vulgaris]
MYDTRRLFGIVIPCILLITVILAICVKRRMKEDNSQGMPRKERVIASGTTPQALKSPKLQVCPSTGVKAEEKTGAQATEKLPEDKTACDEKTAMEGTRPDAENKNVDKGFPERKIVSILIPPPPEERPKNPGKFEEQEPTSNLKVKYFNILTMVFCFGSLND